MGRYYNGDIEGKFWFGVQSSCAADRFGTTGTPPETELYYNYTKDNFNVESLTTLLRVINKEYETEFTLETDPDELNGIAPDSDIADAQLGLKIYQCILENEECSFTAEL